MQTSRIEPFLNSLIDAKPRSHYANESAADPVVRASASASFPSSSAGLTGSIDVSLPLAALASSTADGPVEGASGAAARGSSPTPSSTHTPLRCGDDARHFAEVTPAQRFRLAQTTTRSELSVSVDDASTAFSPRGSDFGEDECDDDDANTWRRFFARPHRSKATSVTHLSGGSSLAGGDALSEVSPGLYIGSSDLLKLPELLKAAKVHTLINCAEETELDFADAFLATAGMRPAAESVVRVAMVDSDDFDSTEALEVAAEDLHELLSSGRAVAVCCKHGMNRSVSVVLAYMVKFRKLSLRDAYTSLRQKRRIAYPNVGFWRTLQQLEVEETGASSVPEWALVKYHGNQTILRHSLSQTAGATFSRGNSAGLGGGSSSKAYAVSRSASVGGRAAPGSAPDVLGGHGSSCSGGAGSGSGSGSAQAGPGDGVRRRPLPHGAFEGGARMLFSDAADGHSLGRNGDSRSSSGSGYYGPSGRSSASAPVSAVASAVTSPVASPRRVRHGLFGPGAAATAGVGVHAASSAGCSSPRHRDGSGSEPLSRRPPASAEAVERAMAHAGRLGLASGSGPYSLAGSFDGLHVASSDSKRSETPLLLPCVCGSAACDGRCSCTGSASSSACSSEGKDHHDDSKEDHDDDSDQSLFPDPSHGSASGSVHAHALDLHLHSALACSSPRARMSASEPLSSGSGLGTGWRSSSSSGAAFASATIPAVRSPLSMHARTNAARLASGSAGSGSGPMLAFAGRSSPSPVTVVPPHSAAAVAAGGLEGPSVSVSVQHHAHAVPASAAGDHYGLTHHGLSLQSPPHAARPSSAGSGAASGVSLNVLSLPLSAAAGPCGSPPAGRMWPVGVLTVTGAASEPSDAASGSGAGSARSNASLGGATDSPGVVGTERNHTGNYGYCSPASSSDAAALHSQERSRCSMGSCRSDAAAAPGRLTVSMHQYDQSTLGHTGRVSGSSPPFDVSSGAKLLDRPMLAGQGQGHGWSGTGSSIGELSTTPSSVARLSSRGLTGGFGSSSGVDSGSGGSGASGRLGRAVAPPLSLPTLLVDGTGSRTGAAGTRAAGSSPADHAAFASALASDSPDRDALLTGRITARSFEQAARASTSPASLASPSYTLSATHAAPPPSAR